MKYRPTHWITAVLVLGIGVSLSADRVKLKSGKVVEGMFVGADSKAVRILLDTGKVTEIGIDDAVSVEFTPRKPTPPPPPPPNPATQPKPVQVPSGTPINVRLTQGIDVDASKAGQSFKAIVDDPVMMNGSIVIPRGATAELQAVAVQQSGKMKGSDKISLKMNSIGFGGNVYQVTTAYVETKGGGEGKKTARKVGGGAGLGAIVGGIAGGGSGAAIGAAVGGATGAVVASGGEEHLKLP
ncbi:MAG TPA: hypothetical protein VFL49_02645, partial [Pseudolabrys sp.]|nr:hypothetical protein [Pseudolabrys sp.]